MTEQKKSRGNPNKAYKLLMIPFVGQSDAQQPGGPFVQKALSDGILFSGPNAFAEAGLCLLLHALAVSIITVLSRLKSLCARLLRNSESICCTSSLREKSHTVGVYHIRKYEKDRSFNLHSADVGSLILSWAKIVIDFGHQTTWSEHIPANVVSLPDVIRIPR